MTTAPSKPAPVSFERDLRLPRVLLLGDSIAMGYLPFVRASLHGRATVHGAPENCGDTGRGLRRLETWLGADPWAVIHFNFGLHDMKYLDAQGNYITPVQGKVVSTLRQYESQLRALATLLKRTGATLLYATTTPVPDGTLARIPHGELAYNAAARRVMRDADISINDLHAIAATSSAPGQRPNDVHFTEAGYRRLAEAVSASVAAVLPPTDR